MSKNTGLLLIVWNVVLTALAGWLLIKGTGKHAAGGDGDAVLTDTVLAPSVARDTSALSNARIAYFSMDSLREHLDLLKDRFAHLASEGKKAQRNWEKRMSDAQAEADQLLSKDETYMTQAEREADARRLQDLQMETAGLKDKLENDMVRLERDLLIDFSKELDEHLTEYNRTAGFDYIISVQPDGQVWVGNRGLDITPDLLRGLNAKYQARKNAPPKIDR